MRLAENKIVSFDFVSSGSMDLSSAEIGTSIFQIDTVQNVIAETKPQTVETRHEGDLMPFTVEQADGVFLLILFCFLFFTHLYSGGVVYLKEKIKLLFSFNSERRVLYNQVTAKETIYSYFLVIQAIVFMSICFYDGFVLYSEDPVSSTPLITLFTFILLIALFFGFKDVLYQLIGYVFDVESKILLWRQKSIAIIQLLGIIYFIPTLLLLYADIYDFQILLFMGILFLIAQLIFFYQIIIFFIEEKFNFLCLIAYLCTFEILPYISLFIGMVYLYRIDVLSILWH